VDIDDIFVGKEGTQMNTNDVKVRLYYLKVSKFSSSFSRVNTFLFYTGTKVFPRTCNFCFIGNL
jgi:hypothetical protein